MGDSNQFRKSGVDESAVADSRTGVTVDPGPYEAIVVSHVEGSRMGQLKVYIPEWGGVQSDPDDQITVSYASPFFGQTFGTDTQEAPPGAFSSGQSYGMWFIPPDVGNTVLVTFCAGSRDRGYWFACVMDTPSHHMVPGNGRNIGGPKKPFIDPNQSGDLAGHASSDSVLPVVEATTAKLKSLPPDFLTNTERYAHPYQSMVLIAQGLDRDPIRGAISSSSMREAPSNVYGISTPGRSVTTSKQVSSNTMYNADQAVIARRGGHSFVMDDGDKDGKDQLIRLRTTGGHQILMNDTERILYIASSTGNQWLEFSEDGAINVYGGGGFNLRSEGPINFHSEAAILMNSAGPISINGDMGVNITSLMSASMSGLVSASVKSDGLLNLSAVGAASLTAGAALSVSSVGLCNIMGSIINLNSPSYLPKSPAPVLPTPTHQAPDVTYNGQYWQYAPGSLQTTCTVVPAHEPWIDPATGKRPEAMKNSGVGILGSIGVTVAASAATKIVAGL